MEKKSVGTPREKIRLLVFGILMLAVGALVPSAMVKLFDEKRDEERKVQPDEPLKAYSPDNLKELLKGSPFPAGTHFFGLTRSWNFQWERQQLEMAKWSSQSPGKYVKRFNRYGFADDEDFPLAKPEGELRVLVIGDSNIEGYCPNAHAVPQVLSALLKNSIQKPVRVINAGISASGLFDQVLRYEHLGRLFEPDLVVFAVTMSNDLLELLPSKRPNYLHAEKNGFSEYGPLVVNANASDRDRWTSKSGLGADVKLEQETRRLRFLEGQDFKPHLLELDEKLVSGLRDHEGMLEEFHRGAFHQGAQQKLYLGRVPSLYRDLEQRMNYCFWRLARLLEEEKSPPGVLIMLLPSSFELKPEEIRAVVEKIETYLKTSSPAHSEPPEAEIRQAFIRAIEKHLKLEPGEGVTDPSPRLKGKSGIFLVEDFHFSVQANQILAEEMHDAAVRVLKNRK